MEELTLYSLWLNEAKEDKDLIDELAAIKGETDKIQDRFYRDLEFGTGGLRGVIGAGTNRMNIYTIRKATQGIANWLNSEKNDSSVAISYDSRIKSDLFAKETARVLAGNGIKVYIYDHLMPTPALSFAVRELNCDAGIMITASHNPAKYNGYKVYGEDGCQITIETADKVLSQISKVDIFNSVELVSFESAINDGTIEYIKPEVEESFLNNVRKQAIYKDVCEKAELKVVYTPLNGTGNLPVRKILAMSGVKDITVVKEQEKPDGTFKTCPFPNPEIPEALHLGLELSKEVKPDLLLATDPDCDRVGIAVPNKNGEYVLITGNEVGALLMQYICKGRIANNTMPQNPVAVKTIVTSELAAKIARAYNVEVIDVLTGFKFIGEQIHYLEEKGEEKRYIFGFEESYGYLAGTYVRDKDAVVASMLICEMAAYYKLNGISVLDALNKIYEEYGIYLHEQQSFTCEGAAGMEKMKEIMNDLRTNPPKMLAGHNVVKFTDYLKGIGNLPKSDVLGFVLDDEASVVLRPSGTEPKIKAYYTAIADTKAEAKAEIEALKVDFTKAMGF